MRVPDLNWPVNLFEDAVMTETDTIVVLADVPAAKPALWREMVNTWIGDGGPFDAEWSR